MKKSMVLLLLLSGLVLSCETGPKPEAESLAPEPAEPAAYLAPSETTDYPEEVAEANREPSFEILEASVEKVFDPKSISEAVFSSTKVEITLLIYELNWIIKSRDYNAWAAHLADSYFKEISSRDFLDEKTEELYRRDQIVAQSLGRDPNMVEKRILRTAMDYFNYVVVPSRANDSLDDISFLSEDRVRAYTVDERRGLRLVLYDLASINNKWMIVN